MEEYEKKQKDFKDACIPLMKYLSETHHPHTKVIVESNTCELVEGIISYNNNDFIKD